VLVALAACHTALAYKANPPLPPPNEVRLQVVRLQLDGTASTLILSERTSEATAKAHGKWRA
jgi:hypothetical protein